MLIVRFMERVDVVSERPGDWNGHATLRSAMNKLLDEWGL